MTPRIVCLGEGMVEERAGPDGSVTRHYGGDTLNIAIHLARSGCNVAFATALGDDAASDKLVAAWEGEGVDCSLALRHPDRTVGRYRITLDESGERSFSYDRAQSAARDMFSAGDQDMWRSTIASADMLVFSLISLAILPEAGREALLELAQSIATSGGQVAFDGNYRPLLWESPDVAQDWRDRAIATAAIGLPTLEDETALGSGNARDVARHWSSIGCSEVMVKLGAEGCLLPDGTLSPPPQKLLPVDTSGAGDAFDAGYLAARTRGAGHAEAASAGHSLAGWAIGRRGAIPERDREAPYPAA